MMDDMGYNKEENGANAFEIRNINGAIGFFFMEPLAATVRLHSRGNSLALERPLSW